jgi:hypothetical protein
MSRKLQVWGLALLFSFGLGRGSGFAAQDSIVGRWHVVAQTPNGPLELQFQFREESGQLVGAVGVSQMDGTITTAKYVHPDFSAELRLDGNSYKLTAVMKDGKLFGDWERVGGDMKGTWVALRDNAPPPSDAAAGPVTGLWDTVAVTPDRELKAALQLTQDGEKVTGEIRTERVALPIQSASFKADKLVFTLDLGGTAYRVEAALKDGSFTGNWAPVAGGEGGAWRAARRAEAAPAPPAKSVSIPALGLWMAVASSPDGELRAQLEIKQTGEMLAGTFATAEGSIPLQKVAFLENKLTFDVDYMGGTYHIEANLVDGKLAGKWTAVGGTESGKVSAERKK